MSSERERRSQERIAQAEERKAARARERVAQAAQERAEKLASLSFSRKLDRASEHIEDLRRTTNEWLGTDAYRLVSQTNAQTGRTVIRAHISEPPSPRIPILIGDAVHNLRAALDHLALELAVSHYRPATVPPEIERASEFPIFFDRGTNTGHDLFHRINEKTREPVRGSGLHKLGGIHPDALKAIEGIQPYHRGSVYAADPLWVINELDRIDKHRRLNLAAYALGSVEFGDAQIGSFHAEKLGHHGPVEHGTVVATFVARNARFQLKFSRQITLAEPTVAGFAVEALTGLRDYLREGVVPLLERFL